MAHERRKPLILTCFIACSATVDRLTLMDIRLPTLLLLFCSCFQACAAIEWHQCSEGPFTPHSVTLKPDPPKIGQDISFDILGAYHPDDSKIIPQGVLDVAVNFMGTPIFQTQWDLCSKTSCPISPGDLDIHYSQTLPPIAPPGQYRVELAAHGDDGEPLLCLVVDFSIGPPSLASVLRGDR